MKCSLGISNFLEEISAAAAVANLLQSCPTLCDPRDGSPLGSPIPGILQARTLEGVAISFSNAWKWKVKVKLLRHVQLLANPWTAAYQDPLSMGFARQEYWSGLPFPSLGRDLSSFPRSLVFPILLFSSISLHWGRLSYLFLLFFGTLHSNRHIFPILLWFLLLFFSQLFVRPPQTVILLFCISFSWG